MNSPVSTAATQTSCNRLAGKRAFVTGGGGGIGQAIAELFVAEGATVACFDQNEEAVTRVVEGLNVRRNGSVAVTGDVTALASVEAGVAKAAEALGGIDIVVNNVGLSARGTVETTDESTWDRTSLNTKSIYLVSRFAIPHMRKAGGGAIVNIGSGTGIMGSPNTVAYGTAKAAVVGMTKLMALDHAVDGIRVNCLCPGLTETNLSKANRQRQADREGITLDEITARMVKNYPLGRLGQPIDIARGVLFLASDEASWVTGATLVVDGGRCAGSK